jgi:hypothetical protein
VADDPFSEPSKRWQLVLPSGLLLAAQWRNTPWQSTGWANVQRRSAVSSHTLGITGLNDVNCCAPLVPMTKPTVMDQSKRLRFLVLVGNYASLPPLLKSCSDVPTHPAQLVLAGCPAKWSIPYNRHPWLRFAPV